MPDVTKGFYKDECFKEGIEGSWRPGVPEFSGKRIHKIRTLMEKAFSPFVRH